MQAVTSFTNTEWNRNVENPGSSLGHRKSKQTIQLKPGTAFSQLQMNEPYKAANIEQLNQTYLKSTKKERPPSRGSTRAHSVIDFDWYGNSRDVSILNLNFNVFFVDQSLDQNAT